MTLDYLGIYCEECGAAMEIVDNMRSHDGWKYLLQCTNDRDMFEEGSCSFVYNDLCVIVDTSEIDGEE